MLMSKSLDISEKILHIMLLPSEFVTQWGSVGLLKPSSDLLENIDMPQNATTFLHEAGLPFEAEVVPGISSAVLPVAIDSSLVPASRHLLFSQSPFTQDSCLMLARLLRDGSFWSGLHFWNGEYPLYFALETGSGKLRVIGPPLRNTYEPEFIDQVPDYFANSSLPHLMEFFLAGRVFTAHYWFRWFYAHNQVPALVDALERKWRRIDPVAMADPAHWWPKNVQSLRSLYQRQLQVLDETQNR